MEWHPCTIGGTHCFKVKFLSLFLLALQQAAVVVHVCVFCRMKSLNKASVLAHVTLEGLAVLRTAEDTDKQFSLLTRASAIRKSVSQTQLSMYIPLGSGNQSDALNNP